MPVPSALPAAPRAPALSPVARYGLVLVAIGTLALVGGEYELRFGAEILIFGTAVLALDILVGFGGLVSLGHAALFGGAAYAAALASHAVGGDLLLVLAIGATTGAAAAALMGALVVRTANLFFLLLTLVAGQILWEVVFHAREVAGGADGMRGLPPLRLHLPFGEARALGGARELFLIASVVALAAYATARSFVNAPIGRALVGSREQPLRMQALGYGIAGIRMRALLVSGALAGAAGALYPFVNLYVGPSVVHWSTSAAMIIMLVIGGVGSLWGAYLGAGIYLGIQTYLSSYTERWQLLVGLLFVLTVLVAPNGLASLAPRLRRIGMGRNG